MRKFTKALVLAVGLGAASAASADTIDNFNVPGAPGYALTTTTSVNDTQGGFANSDVIGGSRHVSIGKTGGNGELDVRINFFQPGRAALSSDTGVAGNFTFAYGSLIPSGTALGADLSSDDLLRVIITAADFGANMNITMADSDSSHTVTVPFSAGASVLNVPLGSFAGIDMSDVDGLSFEVVGVDSLDMSIDNIATVVPLPAAAWPGAILLGGLVVRKLRRRS